MSKKCALYRHFDKNGILLYVGISNGVLVRSSAHKHNAHWFENIIRIDIEWFPSRDAALWAEETAIRKENPKHNLWRADRIGPKSRQPEIEEKRLAIFAEAAGLGIKLDRRSCLDVLEEQMALEKSKMGIDRAV